MAKFEQTFCSQCGEEFGPGDSGYSHCSDHASSDYFQGPERTVIQIERRDHHDWIVWNWNRARWDEHRHKIAADGKPEAE